jgi:hypothetical protein
VVSQGLFEFFLVFLFGVFQSLFLVFFSELFRGFSIYDLLGIYA